MSDIQTKTNESKTDKTKSNGTKPDEARAEKFAFDVPLGEQEGLTWLTEMMQDARGMRVRVVSVRMQEGRMVPRCVPIDMPE